MTALLAQGSDHGFPLLFQDGKFYGYMFGADLSDPGPRWNTQEEAWVRTTRWG